jgi:hypothetical protein
MTDGIFMDRISGGLANRKYRQALRRKLSRNYRIVPDRRKGQSAFARCAASPRTRGARRVDTFSSRLREQQFPARELHYYERNGGALFRGRELGGRGTFKVIGGSHAQRRCLSSEAAAR